MCCAGFSNKCTDFTPCSNQQGQDQRYAPTVTNYLLVANKFQLTALHTEELLHHSHRTGSGNSKVVEEVEVMWILLIFEFMSFIK